MVNAILLMEWLQTLLSFEVTLLQTFLTSSCHFIADSFNSKLQSPVDTAAPPLKLKESAANLTPPRKNKDIKLLKRNCPTAERKSRNNKLMVNYQIFHEQLTIYNKAIKQARQAYFSI